MRGIAIFLTLSLLTVTQARADEPEATAVKLVESLGGTLSRDGKGTDGKVIVANLDKTKVADEDLKRLAAFKHLMVLNLYGTSVTDKGLKNVAALKELQGLDLRATRVKGEGLKELAALKKLQMLFLSKEIPAAAVARLKKALPDCKIVR